MKKYFLILLLSICSSTMFGQGFSPMDQQKLSNVMSAISNMYVDTINGHKLVESAIVAMLRDLDPHSVYIPRQEVEAATAPLDGRFEGVGIQFQVLEDTIFVVQTIAGCPAEKVGMRAGDRIIYINDELVAGTHIKNSDVMKKLRGPKGSEVTVKVLRREHKGLITFKITRDIIPLHSVDAHYMIDKKIGYIKINNFGRNTVDEFNSAFQKLKKEGMKSLIVSLQGNGGGYLTAARGMANEFLGNGKLIVYTKGLHQPKTVLVANNKGDYEKGKLIILVNEYSASASEILTGALQDWDRAVVVGRRTFGKGLVQQQIPLLDGSVIRLTTARYYTPSGRCIQKSYADGIKKYEEDIANRYKHGELLHADSIHFPDSLKYHTLVLKRTVYGGGGIMPDIFVPIDTTLVTEYNSKIVEQGILNNFTVEYIDNHRKELQKEYPNFKKFKKNFEVTDDMLNHLADMATKAKIKYNSKQFEKSKKLISLQIKALIARDLWTMNEYYQIMDVENESLQKAVQILETPGEYEKILPQVNN